MAEVGRSNRPEPTVFSAFFDEISHPNASSSYTKKLSTPAKKLSTRTYSSPDQKCGYQTGSASQQKYAPSTSSTLDTTREETLSTLTLPYNEDELTSYVYFRMTGLVKKSRDWILRAARHFWRNTGGIISQETVEQFRTTILTKYKSEWSHGKTLAFAQSFLKYLTRICLDTRYFADALDRNFHNKSAHKIKTVRIVHKVFCQNVGHIRRNLNPLLVR